MQVRLLSLGGNGALVWAAFSHCLVACHCPLHGMGFRHWEPNNEAHCHWRSHQPWEGMGTLPTTVTPTMGKSPPLKNGGMSGWELGKPCLGESWGQTRKESRHCKHGLPPSLSPSLPQKWSEPWEEKVCLVFNCHCHCLRKEKESACHCLPVQPPLPA